MILSILPFALFGILAVIAPSFYGEIWSEPMVQIILAGVSGVAHGRERHHVSNDEIRDLMQTTTPILGPLSRLIEANTEPLLAVSMFGFVFLAVLAIIQAAQSRLAIRKRTIAFNPAYSGAPGRSHPPGRRFRRSTTT